MATHINKNFQESKDIFQHKVLTTALINSNYVVPKDTINTAGKTNTKERVGN